MELQKVYPALRASQLIRTVCICLVLPVAFAYHRCVTPRLEEGRERAELCRYWNAVKDASEQHKREFMDSILRSDQETGEAQDLGFINVRCAYVTNRGYESLSPDVKKTKSYLRA